MTRNLSPQQKKLFFLLFTNLSMKEISGQLNISFKTVDTHAGAIYRKFGVHGRVGLILQVLVDSKGVIPVDKDDAAEVHSDRPLRD